MHEVVVYSKPGCYLCDDVKERLRRLEATRLFRWREVNILDDPETFERYKLDIPVVTIDGEPAFRHYFSERAFLERLQAPIPDQPA